MNPTLLFSLLPSLLKQGRFDFALKSLNEVSPRELRKHFQELFDVFIRYSSVNRAFNVQVSELLHQYFLVELQSLSISELLSYLKLDYEGAPSVLMRGVIVETRSLDAGIDKSLLDWIEDEAPQALIEAFQRYLGRFTSVELQKYGELLATLVFSEHEVLVYQFDLWQGEFEKLFPNFSTEVVLSWLALDDARLLKHSKRFTEKLESPTLLQQTLGALLSDPSVQLMQLLSELIERTNTDVVNVALDVIGGMNNDILLSSSLIVRLLDESTD